jgi:Tfp pilus assembly protein PilF
MTNNERLDSWKEIAAYLKRGVRTVQRWERVAGLPVRRVPSTRGAVYAFRAELDQWWRTQSVDRASEMPATQDSPAFRPVPAGSGVRPQAVNPPAIAAAAAASMRVRPFIPQTLGIDPIRRPLTPTSRCTFSRWSPWACCVRTKACPRPRAAAQRALELDPSIAEAHAISGVVASHYERDWAAAERRFEVALSREPVSSSVRFHYAAWHLSPLGCHAEALTQVKLGLADDPLYLLGRIQLGVELQSLGRSDEGLAELEAVLRFDPRFGPALGLVGREYAMRGRVAEALSLAEQTFQAAPRHANAVGFLAGMLRRTGSEQRADAILSTLDGDSAWARARARAESHVVCLEFDAALDALEVAVAARDPGVWIVVSGTAGNAIRSMTAWQALCAQLGLSSERSPDSG